MIKMPTFEDVRRAILESRRFIENLYKEISGGNYGVTCEYETGSPFGVKWIYILIQRNIAGLLDLL